MINQIKNILKISFVFIGTILGAGFASGKELVSFFAKFGKLGIFGFSASCLLFFFSCLAILSIIQKSSFKTYEEFMESIYGKSLGKIILYLNAIFLFSIFFIMIAGGASTITIFFKDLNIKLASLIFTLTVLITLIFGEKAIIKINSFISPILIVGIICFGVYISLVQAEPTFKNVLNVTYSSIIYSSYNIITTIAVLFSIKKLITNEKVSFFSAFLSSGIIFLIGLFIILPLVKNYSIVSEVDFPIVFLIGENRELLKYIYSVILFLAIFTTAIGNIFAFVEFLKEKLKLNSLAIKITTCFLGLLFSFIGFSTLIEQIYPLFGYLGAFQLVVILLHFLSK